MWTKLDNILEVLRVVICAFFIERYVFLEPGIKGKKKKILYLLVIIAVAAIFVGRRDVALFPVALAVGLNISLGRKSHRVLGFFLLWPVWAIVDGITILVFTSLPYVLFGVSKTETLVYDFIIHALFFLLLFLFYKKGKKWRELFDRDLEHRYLQKWELFLLTMTAVVVDTINFSLAKQFAIDIAGYSAYERGRVIGDVLGKTLLQSLIMAIIVVTIVRGNKTAYYNKRVMDMQFHIIAAMADIVESRDENTGGHIKRTAEYVEIICRQLKKMGAYSDILTDSYIDDMTVAASLHDIGKIHIPDSILNKPGRLTDEEFAIMKSHTTVGKDLLNQAKHGLGDFEYLNMAIDMAEYHHEWWNGKGYPNGISGQEIPLCARIMAVADVFDALTSQRCYKKAMPLEKAYEIMKEETGTHFDPVVMEAFFAVCKDRDFTEELGS